MHLSKEKTLVIIKPDGIQRSLIGEIIGRLERVGLKLIGLKMMVPTEELVKSHYLIDPNWMIKVGDKSLEAYEAKGLPKPDMTSEEVGQKVLSCLVNYFTSGPVIVMAWQGAHAVPIVRKIVGSTEPLTSDVGTIRGDFVLDSYQMSDIDNRSVRNLVHASSSNEDAEKEINIWLDQKDLINYRLVQEQIMYDVNLDGILE